MNNERCTCELRLRMGAQWQAQGLRISGMSNFFSYTLEASDFLQATRLGITLGASTRMKCRVPTATDVSAGHRAPPCTGAANFVSTPGSWRGHERHTAERKSRRVKAKWSQLPEMVLRFDPSFIVFKISRSLQKTVRVVLKVCQSPRSRYSGITTYHWYRASWKKVE